MVIVKEMGASCTRGTPANMVTYKVLQKFRLLFHLYMEGHICLTEEEEAEEEE